MMVLVSIVGDFYSSVIPIFYEFKDDITKHILVYDDFKNDVQKAKGIKKGIKTFCKKNDYNFERLEYILDEDSLESLKSCSKFLLSQVGDAKDLYINTTDGFSSVTTVLNHTLFKKGVNFIAYDMYDNEYNLLNQRVFEKIEIKNSLNISDHFLLKGYAIQASNVSLFAKKYEKSIRNLFEKKAKEYDEFIRHPATNNSVKSLSHNYKEVKDIFLKMDLDDRPIKDPMLTGTMYEAYIFNLLKSLDYDDIEIGMEYLRFHFL